MALIDEAHRRIRQSKKRLAELKDRIESFREVQTGVISVQHKSSDPYNWRYPASEPLDDLSPIISEVVQSLVVGLNYLVCGLAEARGRPVDENLQFPICESPNVFRRRAASELKGLSGEQVALIEALQPYHGNDWLRRIRDLANPDRHRKPIPIKTGSRTKIRGDAISYIETRSARGARVLVPETMQMKYEFGLPILFSDGSPVIELLEVLQLKVSDLLNAFKPFFD